MIKTHVTWTKLLSENELTQIYAHVELMVSQGKTNGEQEWVKNEPEEKIVERYWTTVEDANEWLSFIETYGPASAVIVNE
jgi:hypothetical protein